MKNTLFIFGMGYCATYLADELKRMGWNVRGTTQDGRGESIAFTDKRNVEAALAQASHILSSVPPDGDSDPVLREYGAALIAAPAQWRGYLSSTGVYGDCGGAWVDESAPIGHGRRPARAQSDLAWQKLGKSLATQDTQSGAPITSPSPSAAPHCRTHIFRLPGIYGPSRSALTQIAQGRAYTVDAPHHKFSRIHVRDISRAIIASFTAPAGVYNIADDMPAEPADVFSFAAQLLKQPPLPRLALNDPALPASSCAYYTESRQVSNAKAKRLLGWQPLYPDYKSGLRSLFATL